MNLEFNKIGADIEVPAFDFRDEPISVIDYIKGTKNKPEPLLNGGFIHHDNVLVEYNIKATDNLSYFNKALYNANKEVEERLKLYHLHPKYISTLKYLPIDLMNKEAQAIGCEGDYNAWTEEPNLSLKNNLKVLEYFQNGNRSAGGHVHFSFKNIELKDFKPTIFKIIRRLDYYLTLPSLLYDFKGAARRLLYGSPGACRYIVNYPDGSMGGEFRVLSNFWANPYYHQIYSTWIFNNLVYILTHLDNIEEPPDEVYDIIKKNNIRMAIKYMKKHQLGIKGEINGNKI